MTRQEYTYLLKLKLKEAALVLPHFSRNPKQMMRTLPDWDWATMIVLQVAFAVATFALKNLVERDIVGLFVGLFLGPLVTVLITGITAGFFYYVFLFFFHREIPIERVYQSLVFASLPIQIVNIVSSFVPPLMLLGVTASFLLLLVAFVDGFQLDAKKSRQLLLVLASIYFFSWILTTVEMSSSKHKMHIRATPESLDILEKELNP